MVIGNGLVAKAFAEFESNDDVVVFASGVSNSSETRKEAFAREIDLLDTCINRYGDKKWIYCSTCSITDPSLKNSKYVAHKLEIEKTIQSCLNDYVIFRASNIIGESANPNVVLNYLVNCISQGKKFQLWKYASRNFIDIDDVVTIVGFAVREKSFRNEVVNIANPTNIGMEKLVDLIEKYFEKPAVCVKLALGGAPVIDISLIREILEKNSIEFGDDYFENLLRKYYRR